ncbi:MAG: hypothetical protein ACC652_01040 [Acidimicrobiales bacterium]
MRVFADRNGRHSVPDFVPRVWLTEFEADARQQVGTARAESVEQSQAHRPSAWRVCAVIAAGVVVAVICAITIFWAVMMGSALALWPITSFWVLSGVSFSVWVGWHADAVVDAAASW